MGSDHKRTPSTWYVRETYAHEDRYGGSMDHEKLAEFDAWLNEVKAQAWDEGYVAGADPHCGSQALNPYRKGN